MVIVPMHATFRFDFLIRYENDKKGRGCIAKNTRPK